MAKAFISGTGASVVIASNEHCPPHVHAMHREEGWVVRLSFSFLSAVVEVMSVAPNENRVRQKQLNVLRRGHCRQTAGLPKTLVGKQGHDLPGKQVDVTDRAAGHRFGGARRGRAASRPCWLPGRNWNDKAAVPQ